MQSDRFYGILSTYVPIIFKVLETKEYVRTIRAIFQVKGYASGMCMSSCNLGPGHKHGRVNDVSSCVENGYLLK